MTEQYMDILEKREKEPEWKDIITYAKDKENIIIEKIIKIVILLNISDYLLKWKIIMNILIN